MTMMKPNNGQLQSPPGQRMSVYKLARQPLLCGRVCGGGGNNCCSASVKIKKLVLQDMKIGEICKLAKAATRGCIKS